MSSPPRQSLWTGSSSFFGKGANSDVLSLPTLAWFSSVLPIALGSFSFSLSKLSLQFSQSGSTFSSHSFCCNFSFSLFFIFSIFSSLLAFSHSYISCIATISFSICSSSHFSLFSSINWVIHFIISQCLFNASHFLIFSFFSCSFLSFSLIFRLHISRDFFSCSFFSIFIFSFSFSISSSNSSIALSLFSIFFMFSSLCVVSDVLLYFFSFPLNFHNFFFISMISLLLASSSSLLILFLSSVGSSSIFFSKVVVIFLSLIFNRRFSCFAFASTILSLFFLSASLSNFSISQLRSFSSRNFWHSLYNCQLFSFTVFLSNFSILSLVSISILFL